MDQVVELEGIQLSGVVAREAIANMLEQPSELGPVEVPDELARDPSLGLLASITRHGSLGR